MYAAAAAPAARRAGKGRLATVGARLATTGAMNDVSLPLRGRIAERFQRLAVYSSTATRILAWTPPLNRLDSHGAMMTMRGTMLSSVPEVCVVRKTRGT